MADGTKLTRRKDFSVHPDRDKYDIINDIMEEILEGRVGKTEIMYGARLSFAQLQYYINYLIQSNMIVPMKADKDLHVKYGSRMIYTMTERGMRFHNLMVQVKNTFSPVSKLEAEMTAQMLTTVEKISTPGVNQEKKAEIFLRMTQLKEAIKEVSPNDLVLMSKELDQFKIHNRRMFGEWK